MPLPHLPPSGYCIYSMYEFTLYVIPAKLFFCCPFKQYFHIPIPSPLLLGCTGGEIRLADGSQREGRIEICLNNEWGTVCDQIWDNIDAGVACRQLELSSSGSVLSTFDTLRSKCESNLRCRSSRSSLLW